MRKRIAMIKRTARPSWWSLEEGKPRFFKSVWIQQTKKKAVTLHGELPF